MQSGFTHTLAVLLISTFAFVLSPDSLEGVDTLFIGPFDVLDTLLLPEYPLLPSNHQSRPAEGTKTYSGVP